jgi:DNA-binding MarR family transcriptional regulator
VSSEFADGAAAEAGPPPELARRLAYLLKHARERLGELTAAALAPYGLDGRQLAALIVLAACEPVSQQQAARRLGADRTTMVALLDVLEGKGLVSRRPDAQDRRKNVVSLTPAGQVTLRDATRAAEEAERCFLAPLAEAAAGQLRDALCTLVAQPPGAAQAARPAGAA